MARLGEVHPSFADLGDAALDTKRLSSALDELAAVQAGGEKPLWQLRNAPLSEGDADSLPGFTPRSSTPLHDPGLPPGEDGGRGSSSAEHRHGGGGGAAWRHYDSAFSDIAESGGNSRAGRHGAEREEAGTTGRSDGEDGSDAVTESSERELDALSEALARGKELFMQSLPSILGFGLAWLLLSMRGRAQQQEWDYEDEEEEEEYESEEEEEPPQPARRAGTRPGGR